MARAAALAGALLVAACSGNPYVIGRVDDAGAAPPDGPDAADPPGECAEKHQAALFCSGFEASELTQDWAVVESTPDARVERSSDPTHQGSGALHATSAGPESYALVATALPALQRGDLYLRAYAYVPAQLTTRIMNILFVGDAEASEPFQGIDLNLEDGAIQLFSPQSPERYTDTQPIPRGRWFCLRLELSIDDTAGRARVYVDQRLALESERFDTLPDAGINQLRLGIDWSSAQTSRFEIYFDDVVVDSQPLTCDD